MKITILITMLSIISYISGFSQATIVQGEFFVDDYVDLGKGRAIELSPGATLDISTSINLNSLTPGLHKLYVRFKNSEGVWSHTYSRLIYMPDFAAPPSVTGFEYFFDEYVDFGKGTFVTLEEDSTAYPLAAQNLSPGVHLLYTRVKLSADIWSQVSKRLFYVPDSTESANIVRLEYYFTDTLNNNETERYVFDDFTPASSVSLSEDDFAANASALAEGETYTLHIQAFTDQEEATAKKTFTFTITTDPPLKIDTLEVANITCAGEDNGQATITASGGEGELMYSISADSAAYKSDSLFTDLPAGEYIAYVKDSVMVVSKTFTITEPSALVLSLDGEIGEVTCDNPQGGSFQVVASGGSGTYQYKLDDIDYQDNPSFTDLAAGEHIITVQDENGCTQELTVTVNATGDIPEEPIITEQKNAETTELSTEVILVVENVTGNFQWYKDGEPIEGATTNELTLTDAGDYTVTVTNEAGCSATSEVWGITGLEDALSSATRIYPNPVDKKLSIELPDAWRGSGRVQLYVYDMQGALAIQKSISFAQMPQLDLSSLSKGIYLLILRDETWIIRKKIQKM